MSALLGVSPAPSSFTPLDERLVAVFDAPGAVAAGVGVAVLVGAAHALAPGHGKTLAAAFMIGERGRPRDALVLGGVVATMHTASVGLLALAWHVLLDVALLDLSAVTAWLQLVAALLVVLAGLMMVRRHRTRHGRHHHHHRVGDAAAGQWSVTTLVTVGLAGGLVPSPSAFLVLVSGLVTGRSGFALLLVGAFAVGMAVTIGVLGLALVRGRDVVVDRLPPGGLLHRGVVALPVLAAGGVVLGGLALTLTAGLRLAPVH